METGRYIEEKLIDTPTAKEAVLFANNPSYLLSRLGTDSAVSYVGNTFKTVEILNSLRIRSEQPPNQPVELVRIYVLIVALSLKNDLREYRDEFQAINLSHIEWAEQLRELILSRQTPTAFQKFEFQKLEKNAAIESSTNPSTVTITEGRK